MPSLEDPISINSIEIPNRLYRAPLLECAGNHDGTVDKLIEELEPAAESGVGLIFQGAVVVSPEGGCAAPEMTRVHDPGFVSELEKLTSRIQKHGSKIFAQLEYGGLRSMEVWNEKYMRENPGTVQRTVSSPPAAMRVLSRLDFLNLNVRRMSTDEVYGLAGRFADSAEYLVDAGYDGIHISGANMGIVQQFLSPYYNRREDVFGGSTARRFNFLKLVHDRIRERVGDDVPVTTKVPAETKSPPHVRRKIDLDEGVRLAEMCAETGFDAVVPVEVSVYWDLSIVQGNYPERSWEDERFHEGYDQVFGSGLRRKLVSFLNRVEALRYGFEPGWNAGYGERVKRRVVIPVLLEGGIRNRGQMEKLLGSEGDMVGMARPFYAEPRVASRILKNGGSSRDGGYPGDGTSVLCENCNNCTVPQVAGADGVCRTPKVLEKRAEFEREGVYD
ncbi:MAG: NADH:flavin oxidoreductase [Halobacteria archaeon]